MRWMIKKQVVMNICKIKQNKKHEEKVLTALSVVLKVNALPRDFAHFFKIHVGDCSQTTSCYDTELSWDQQKMFNSCLK